MSEPTVAEIMPVLYRDVLDTVAELEARNRRREAARIRAEATRVYSRAWTHDAARRLRELRERGSRTGTLAGLKRTRYAEVLAAHGRSSDVRPELERKPV